MKKWKILIPVIIVCILLAAGGWLFLRLHGSVRVTPGREVSSGGGVTQYRQDDPEWSSDKLGKSSYTMESSGCLVSCIAAAVSMSGGKENPGTLNRLFSENNVYDGEGNIQWDSLRKLDGYTAEVYGVVSAEIIDQCLEDRVYPIVRVRMHGVGSFHYVLIVGAGEGGYICMDPLKDELTGLSEYGNRVYAIRWVDFRSGT